MKGQPKGLIAAALANMGERFGFYIMMAILTLFISAKFGLNETTAGYIYSGFYASIYLLALVGGIIADKTRNYKGTIMWGLVVMSLGYLIIAIPTPTPVSSLPLYLTLTCVGLLVIAFGNGLFKGNLQALVGQMYDNKEFSAKRESGFQIFYMFINIGGFFAPFVAIGVRNWWLKVNNFDYNAKLPELCHEYLAKGEHMAGEGLANLTSYANSAYLDGTPVSAAGLHDFCNGYLDVFNRGFHYAFIAAIVMMLVSLVIYLSNKRRFPDPSKKAAAGGVKASAEEITMSAQEIRQRIYALFAVFGVLLFLGRLCEQQLYVLIRRRDGETVFNDVLQCCPLGVRVRQTQQRAPVALCQTVCTQRVEHVAWQPEQTQLVCHSRLRFPEPPRGLLLTHAEHAYQLAYPCGLLDEVEVATLQIFNERDEACVLHVHVEHYARDLVEPRELCRAQPPLSRNKLIAPAAAAYGERVENTVIFYAQAQLLQRAAVKLLSGLDRVRINVAGSQIDYSSSARTGARP